MKYRAWGQESILISVIAGVYFSHFFMRFSRVLALVRINGVSVIVRCLQGEHRLYTFLLHGDGQFSRMTFSFFWNSLVELSLSMIEARRKAHNKPINTLSGLVHAGEIYELSIARLPTEPYDRTMLSLLVRCLFTGRRKH